MCARSSGWHAPAASGAQSRHNQCAETQPACEKCAVVYEGVEQFLTNVRAPVRARSRVRGTPASFMTRGRQCSKRTLLFVCKRAVHVYRMGAFDASLERGTCSTSWSLRVWQSWAVQRVTEIRNEPALLLLSNAMASLMDGGLTTSHACVQCRSSVAQCCTVRSSCGRQEQGRRRKTLQ